jgi:bifunctional DNA-binding transcriptional regulator/antitoxin component of YhaV-PrlF toxin-antitoxin module
MKKTAKKSAAKGAVRRLTRTGTYTFYVTIPKTDIEALGWRDRQRVTVKRTGSKIVVEAVKGRRG